MPIVTVTMNYLAPIIILAALITTVFLFSPASAHADPLPAAELKDLPGLVQVLPNGKDVVLENDIDDAMFNLPLEKPVLPVMTQPSAGDFEFITLQHVFFDHNSYTLTDDARRMLDNAADYIVNHDTTIGRILIRGHTNDIDTVNYNYRLSDSRAYAVWDYLASRGVDPDRMQVSGMGEMAPIDENWTRLGRQHNRRVDIQIIKTLPGQASKP